MNYYPNLPTTSDQQKGKLIAQIDPGQTGNDSKFKDKFSKYPVSLSRLKANALFAGRCAESAN